jgi:hypothetical protein
MMESWCPCTAALPNSRPALQCLREGAVLSQRPWQSPGTNRRGAGFTGPAGHIGASAAGLGGPERAGPGPVHSRCCADRHAGPPADRAHQPPNPPVRSLDRGLAGLGSGSATRKRLGRLGSAPSLCPAGPPAGPPAPLPTAQRIGKGYVLAAGCPSRRPARTEARPARCPPEVRPEQAFRPARKTKGPPAAAPGRS